MSTQVVLEFPSDLPEEGLDDPEIMTKGKQTIVLELLRKGAVSQDRAAELLEVDREILLDLMAEYKISVIEVTEDREEKPSQLTDPTTATAGAWNGLLDCDQFEKDVYSSRLTHMRPEVRL